ncbi:MAG: hypothetical protein GF375_06525 [Candidatus Omnitrophica bacterium]|nr:hypothetical protein [Candidatus Omnitrophota bacterium]MBD3269629.1 hypothetical protein [Candidatus Omnitrophota bacterium]
MSISPKVRILFLLIFVLTLFYISSFSYAGAGNFIPEKVRYEGKTYVYAPFHSQRDRVFEINLDEEPGNEVFISFAAIPGRDSGKEQFFHFWQILDSGDNGYEAVQTERSRGLPGEVYFKDLNSDGEKEIFVFTTGYGQYLRLAVYSYREGRYVNIWEGESICGIKLELEATPPVIKVASSSWGGKVIDEEGRQLDWCFAAEPLYAVYAWEDNNFLYNEQKSNYEPLKSLR